LGAAVRSGQISDFVPVFSPPREFLRLGGRPAWYLIGIAALAARMRKSLRPSWRTIHTANYLAFVLATAHAILNGTDFAWPVMKVVVGAMAVAAGTVFVSKRVQRRRLKRRR
ncbi:MAG: ferric reductase, partial [Anaerolineae bacterium]|jgi:DMSO/TMAO reductase YedYZ heme-binding membrane subunit